MPEYQFKIYLKYQERYSKSTVEGNKYIRRVLTIVIE